MKVGDIVMAPAGANGRLAYCIVDLIREHKVWGVWRSSLEELHRESRYNLKSWMPKDVCQVVESTPEGYEATIL